MELNCCMFGSTDKDENNWIGELFAFCGRQLLTLADCSTSYGHRLILNTLRQ